MSRLPALLVDAALAWAAVTLALCAGVAAARAVEGVVPDRWAARMVVPERVLVGAAAGLIAPLPAIACWVVPLRVRLSDDLVVDLRDAGPLLLRRVLVARYWRGAGRGCESAACRARRREADFTLLRARAPLLARRR